MPDQSAPGGDHNFHLRRGAGISANFLWHIVTCLIAVVVTLCATWTRNSDQLLSVAKEVSAMSVDLKVFIDKYNGQHEDIAVKLNEMEKHLENDDREIDELRRQLQAVRK